MGSFSVKRAFLILLVFFSMGGFCYSAPIQVTEFSPYSTSPMLLGDTLSFDYMWNITPPPYQQGYNFDVLALQGGPSFTYIGQVDSYQSTGWLSRSFDVPLSLQGLTVAVRFILTDFPPDTDPVAWIDNISSNAPVPEPTTFILLGSGLFGLAGMRKKMKS